MSEKKFDYNPMHQYVERERTRTLLIEATRGDHISAKFRRILVLILIGMAGGAYYWATQTHAGRGVVAELTKDPLADKRAARRAAIAASQKRQLETARSAPDGDGIGVDGGKGDPDDMEELMKMQHSQQALGGQLEAFSEGRAPPPSPDAVKAAMAGQAMPTPEATVTPAPAPAPTPSARTPAANVITAPATLDRPAPEPPL